MQLHFVLLFYHHKFLLFFLNLNCLIADILLNLVNQLIFLIISGNRILVFLIKLCYRLIHVLIHNVHCLQLILIVLGFYMEMLKDCSLIGVYEILANYWDIIHFFWFILWVEFLDLIPIFLFHDWSPVLFLQHRSSF